MSPAETRIPVTRRALVQRINRRLAKKGRFLGTSRFRAARGVEFNHFVVDTKRGVVKELYCNIVELGRRTGALRAYEVLEAGSEPARTDRADGRRGL